jgi:hypothetical protein
MFSEGCHEHCIIYVWQTPDTWTRVKVFMLILEHSVLVPCFTCLTFLSSCMWTAELWYPQAARYLVKRWLFDGSSLSDRPAWCGHVSEIKNSGSRRGAPLCSFTSGVEYHHRSPASRSRRRQRNPVPWGITGHPVPGGYKYGDLVLQVGGPESENVIMSRAGLGPENDCAGEDQQQL